MTQTVPERKTKRADELKPGDWIAGGLRISEFNDTMDAQVLFAYTFASGGGQTVALMVEEPEAAHPISVDLRADRPVVLLTDDRIAALKDEADRAKKIADIRAYADWLEANPGLPIRNLRMQVSTDPHGDVWNSGAEGMAELRRWAGIMGVEIVHPDDDHATATKTIGCAEYKAVAWHHDGRPAEPVTEAERGPDGHMQVSGWKGEGPGTCGVECACGVTYDGFDSLAEARECLDRHIADPEGRNYGRTDDGNDDPTPVSPARVPLHTGGVVDGGQLVDESAYPVTRYFSFGHGQTDPDTGKNLLGHYVTVVARSVEACRAAMFASRYGNRWSFDYDPASPAWQQYGPQWIEHERIDATDADVVVDHPCGECGGNVRLRGGELVHVNEKAQPLLVESHRAWI